MRVCSLTGAMLALAFVLQGCSSDRGQSTQEAVPELATVSGIVDFQEVAPIAKGNNLSVELLDVTEGVSGAPMLAAAQTGDRASSPYAFTLSYDPNLIREGRDYLVRAEIRRDGEVVASSANMVDPFTAEEIALRFHRPAIEPARMGRTISLQGFRWYVESIDGETLDIALEARPYIEVDPKEDTYRGFAGCNTYTGQYSLNGTTLELGPAATTRRACKSGMDTEQTFLAMLDKVGSWRLDDGKMVLGDPGREVLARFVLMSDKPLEDL